MFDLSSYLPYLLNRAGSHIAEAFGRMLRDEFAITLQMWRVLAALHHRDGQRIGALSQFTSIEVSTLSRLVGSMARRGLVERRRAAGDDARAVAVHVTARGAELTRRIVPRAERYERIALQGFTDEEAALLKQMLRRLYFNMGTFAAAAPSGEADERRLAS